MGRAGFRGAEKIDDVDRLRQVSEGRICGEPPYGTPHGVNGIDGKALFQQIAADAIHRLAGFVLGADKGDASGRAQQLRHGIGRNTRCGHAFPPFPCCRAMALRASFTQCDNIRRTACYGKPLLRGVPGRRPETPGPGAGPGGTQARTSAVLPPRAASPSAACGWLSTGGSPSSLSVLPKK